MDPGGESQRNQSRQALQVDYSSQSIAMTTDDDADAGLEADEHGLRDEVRHEAQAQERCRHEHQPDESGQCRACGHERSRVGGRSGLGQCGACTVWVDGKAVRSCVTPAQSVQSKKITTLEGLGSSKSPNKLQQAFIDTQAVQCGYCINGMLMTAQALLNDNPRPSEQEVTDALAGHLCRCGTHQRIVQAIMKSINA